MVSLMDGFIYCSGPGAFGMVGGENEWRGWGRLKKKMDLVSEIKRSGFDGHKRVGKWSRT